MDAGQTQRLAQEVTAKLRQKGQQGRRFQKAAAQPVGDGDFARADSLDEAGDAEEGIAAQLKRVAEVVVEAAKNDVDQLQAAEHLEKDTVVAHGQVVAL